MVITNSRQRLLKRGLMIIAFLALSGIWFTVSPVADHNVLNSPQCAEAPTLTRYFCDRSRQGQCGYTLTTCCRPAPLHAGCTTSFSTKEIVSCGFEPGTLLAACID